MPRFVLDQACVDYCQQWPRMCNKPVILLKQYVYGGNWPLTHIQSTIPKRVNFKLHNYESVGISSKA